MWPNDPLTRRLTQMKALKPEGPSVAWPVGCSGGFDQPRKQPLDCFRSVALESARLAVNRMNDSPPHPDDGTKPARMQDLCRASADGLPHTGNRVRIRIRRIHALEFDSHLTRGDVDVRVVDRDVVATAGPLADLANVEIQSAPPPR
jgi:hypothetical protein